MNKMSMTRKWKMSRQAKKTGQPIASLVTVRKYKVDAATGMIKKRKVRHKAASSLTSAAERPSRVCRWSLSQRTYAVGDLRLRRHSGLFA